MGNYKANCCFQCGHPGKVKRRWKVVGKWGSGANRYDDGTELCEPCLELNILAGDMYWTKAIGENDQKIWSNKAWTKQQAYLDLYGR